MRSLRFLFAVPVVLALAGCEAFGNLNLYSDEELEPLSAQAYEEASNDHRPITSGAMYSRVQSVAQKITAAADEPNFAWEARLLDAPDIPNAFCLPNGRIAIYSGIMQDGLADTPDMLAAIMGHEVAHAILRHGGKRMTQGLVTNIAQAVIDAGVSTTEISEESKGLLMTAVGATAQYGVLLPYSRTHETEADVLGLRYAVRAGYDPNAAPELWERMAKLGGGTPAWLSTHPDPLERAETLRKLIPQIQAEEKDWRPAAAAPK